MNATGSLLAAAATTATASRLSSPSGAGILPPKIPASTATSAARLYWEETQSIGAALASGQAPPKLSLPVGFTVFPSEIIQAPRSWAEKVYPNLIYFNEADKGGHFAAWEEPEIFAAEVRAAFRSLR